MAPVTKFEALSLRERSTRSGIGRMSRGCRNSGIVCSLPIMSELDRYASNAMNTSTDCYPEQPMPWIGMPADAG